MFAKTVLTGVSALIIASSFAVVANAGQKPTARIWYDSQTTKSVNIVYMNLPQASHVRYVNVTSGKQYAPKKLPLSGNGTYSVPIGNLATGQYYLLAQNSNGKYLSQTVNFYISKETVGSEL